MKDAMQFQGSEVAIVGMACRFPGAPNLEAFWANLTAGVESIRVFTEAELVAAGIDPHRLEQRGYVKAAPVLDDHDAFDAAFFGISPKDAALMDPQHRVFLEVSWTALEHAGYAPNAVSKRVGVYASASYNAYLIECLKRHPDIEDVEGANEVMWGNDPSYMPTRVAYKLDLRGPAMNVDTACSSSLTAVHLACQALLLDECDFALAGGVNVRVPQTSGYVHEPGMIVSSDGHCRAFSDNASGTIFGSGAGAIVMKRLADAIADHDTIYAIIRATALNNDGSAKLGFTAPSVGGQVRVMRAALGIEDIDPSTIGYVEAHGTGTKLGDAVEWEALAEVYGASAAGRPRCGIGSVKTNFGHLVSAAGIAGLIKTALALHHKQIPPTLHVQRASEDTSRLFVVDRLQPFEQVDAPRRAAVTSLGVGGTNAHVILEEAPAGSRVRTRQAHHLIRLSAATPAALATLTTTVTDRLRAAPDGELGDLAFTLATGRAALAHNSYLVVGRDATQRTILGGTARAAVATAPSTVFMFPGNGSQYLGMCRDLYLGVPAFKDGMDRCDEILRARRGIALVETLYGDNPTMPTDASFVQPALFAIEYALARVLIGWGITPRGMIGHSLGEYVCACLADVFSLEDGLELVAARGALMADACRGKMLSVLASAERTAALVTHGISIAAINTPAATTVSGAAHDVEAFAAVLDRAGIEHLALPVDHAFHSILTENIFEPFAQVLGRVRFAPPRIPYISNLTGDWIRPDEPTSPSYWLQHARRPVLFLAGVEALRAVGATCFVEVGPGTTLSGFAASDDRAHTVVATVRHRRKQQDDVVHLLASVGQCWQAGVAVDWHALAGDHDHVRVAAPTYPFDRVRHWYPSAPPGPRELPARERAPALWVPSWQPQQPPRPAARRGTLIIVLGADRHQTHALAAAAATDGATVVTAVIGGAYERRSATRFVVEPAGDDFTRLLADIGGQHDAVVWVHALGIGGSTVRTSAPALPDHLITAYQSILDILRAATRGDRTRHTIAVLADEVFVVGAGDTVVPHKAVALGPCKVIPQEYPQITTMFVDVGRELADPDCEPRARAILDAVLDPALPPVVAFREGQVYRLGYRALATTPAQEPPVRDDGVYLITGGTGVVGSLTAELLGTLRRTKVILLSRTLDPDRRREIEDRVARTGGTVVFAQADVGRADELRAALSRLEAEHGAIRGVIHAAGLVGSNSDFISQLTPGRSMAFFAAKIAGAENLIAYFEDRPLDFGVFISSSSAVLGGMGDCAYASANIFLDHLALALGCARASSVWRSATWDQWPSARAAASRATGYGVALARSALTERDARAAMLAVLATTERPCLSVSVDDFAARVEQWTHLRTPTPEHEQPSGSPTDVMRQVAEVWHAILGVQGATDANFFDLGGSSFSGLRLVNKLEAIFACNLKVLDLFENPTIDTLAKLIELRTHGATERRAPDMPVASAPEVRPDAGEEDEIAIVGIAGRFPGADSPAELWAKLIGGQNTITYFREDEIVDPLVPEAARREGYTRARGVVRNAESFDHLFFGYSLHESRLIDPQHRVFLECAHEAFEDAGIVPTPEIGHVGVFASTSMSSYFNNYIVPAGILQTADRLAAIIGNSVDALATRVSYKLNLTGPSVSIQTFCSSTLVALHEAVTSIRAGQCDLAVVGGSTIVMPQQSGYVQTPGDITASDGVVRPFDNRAGGTVFSNGAGAVLLKRYRAAVRDRDHIYCVVRATGINNDGSVKAGFSAPSVGGQEAVIDETLARSGLTPRDIHYVETHGTGTRIGDPIELTALTRSFARHTDARQFCAVGSIKGNIGHLDRAAGIASVIKATLVIRHRVIPPTINHATPNDSIDFASSPFHVNTRPVDLAQAPSAITVGVTSLGFGGTNAHAILRGASAPRASHAVRGPKIVIVSGLVRDAVTDNLRRLADFLDANPHTDLSAVAFTLQTGRRQFPFRVAVVCESVDECVRKLREVPEGAIERAAEAPVLGDLHVFGESNDAQARFLAPLIGEPLFHEIARDTNAGYPAIFGAWLRRLGIVTGSRGDGHARSFDAHACAAGPFAIVASMWMAGARVDWKQLATAAAHRISLPTYAFQRVPCTLPLPQDPRQPSHASMARQLVDFEEAVRAQLAAWKP